MIGANRFAGKDPLKGSRKRKHFIDSRNYMTQYFGGIRFNTFTQIASLDGELVTNFRDLNGKEMECSIYHELFKSASSEQRRKVFQ